MRIFLTILGVILLLPGACGAFFTFVGLFERNTAPVLMIAVPSLLLGVFGVWLIYWTWTRAR